MHKEVEFAILRISESRYKLQEELDHMKEVMLKKNQYIHEMEIKQKDMTKENSDLKQLVFDLEEIDFL